MFTCLTTYIQCTNTQNATKLLNISNIKIYTKLRCGKIKFLYLNFS